MKKIILIPDSFKGTLSSTQICAIAKEKISVFYPEAEVVSVPVADGGEGSVDCFLSALNGEKIFVDCRGPYMETVKGFYGYIPQNATAVVEMAAAAGLPMVENRKNPLATTTYGVGELILRAAEKGAKRIIVGLGGSCTNDFGCGAACACGVRFYDKAGKEFIPVGGTLCEIEKIDLSLRSPVLDGVEIVTMCDIDNPPYGETGAAVVFAPQKGADKQAVALLDEGVKHLCEVIKRELKTDISTLKGGGAAGAMGAGMAVFFRSELKMGINAVLETVGFAEMIKDADLIFTGEGKIDSQSLRGKVVIGVAKEAKKTGVPVVAIVGGSDGDMTEAYEAGVTAIVPINRLPQDFSVSRYQSEENLAFTVENVLRLLKGSKKNA